MTKIISAFPCMGKTYFASQNPEKSLDLESSDYLFERSGYEHLSSEEFKGIPDRKRKVNGLNDYLKAIDKEMKTRRYKYIFVAQNPEIIKGIIEMGYEVHYIKPNPIDEAEKVFIQRATKRGNSDKWIHSTIKFLKSSAITQFTNEELKKIYIYLIPPNSYLSDFL